MPRPLRSARPFGALFQKLRLNTEDRTALQQAAQLALQVEFSTLPVYLTGMYSIADPASTAYQALRTVAMEEMFHVNQAANMVVGLGALPSFTGAAAPVYPGYLPHANESTTPQLGLYRASADVFNSVYAAIETPAPEGAPAQGDQYDTIAQLYKALAEAIVAYPGNPFDAPAATGQQRTDIYLGKFGGTVLAVTDKDSALHGIQQIVQQGEGTVPNGEPLVPTQPYGAYNHYGQRTDGTYGPILGTPLEMSHFIRFRQIAVSPLPFPETLPITSNPNATQFTNPDALELNEAFNTAYSAMLRGFERSFQTDGGDPYFGTVLNLMHHVLPQLAQGLMNTPAHEGGDASAGPNAAPTWVYQPEARLRDLPAQLRHLRAKAGRGRISATTVSYLEQALEGLRRMSTAPQVLNVL